MYVFSFQYVASLEKKKKKNTSVKAKMSCYRASEHFSPFSLHLNNDMATDLSGEYGSADNNNS